MRRESYTTSRKGTWGCIIEEGKPDFYQRVTKVGVIGGERCDQLDTHNKCRIHFLKHRLSQVWPMLPSQVTPFSRCSYVFIEVSHWTMEEEDWILAPMVDKSINESMQLTVDIGSDESIHGLGVA
jgi:hypothetical protein